MMAVFMGNLRPGAAQNYVPRFTLVPHLLSM